MDLRLLEDKYKIIRLTPTSNIPLELLNEDIFSVTKTKDEISIVVKSNVNINSDIMEDDWKMFQIVGKLEFSLIGILSKISTILASSKISIFVISTYDTDYILVKSVNVSTAIKVLEDSGYRFI